MILTHAHEDHIGALPYLLRDIQVPVYGTAFTLGMVRHKLEEHELLLQTRLFEISPQKSLKLGVFDLEFIRVCHSVPDGVGIIIHTPLGLIVHTGDFKINHTSIDGMLTDVSKFARPEKKGFWPDVGFHKRGERRLYHLGQADRRNL